MVKGASSTEQRLPLPERLERLINLLGLDSAGGLVRSWEEFAASTNRHVVRQAFITIGVRSVFGFVSGPDGRSTFTPIAYLATADNDERAKAIHRQVWSQGVVPLLLIATPSRLEIRRSLAPPPEQPIAVLWDRLESAEGKLPVELASLTGVALRSSAVWRDFAIDRSSRVDKALLEGIVQLSQTIHQEDTKLDQTVVHAVIGRFLYLYVLLDRQIIDASWIAGLTSQNGRRICPTIGDALLSSDGSHVVWPAREVWALFDAIDSVMNGAIFPVRKTRRVGLSDQTLHLIHRVVRHGDRLSPGGRQLSFLDVSFATLRTETISAIYELFLSLESQDEKSDDGAFYTPPFLVDYILDETDRVRPFDGSSRVLDPAAGSGIFLVGAFRRLLERFLPNGPWTARHFRASRKLLEDKIFGFERNPQAANVCRFSLYLTLLDYMNGYNIEQLAKMAKGTQVFPPLIDNILIKDIFEIADKGSNPLDYFSHVVGNPPWGSFGDSATRTNEQRTQERQDKISRSMAAAVAFHASLEVKRFPVANKRLSELFIWKIKRDFLAAGGVLGILISTRSFVSRSASAFPNAMAAEFRLIGIANLSHFRYRLFAEARSPALAIFALSDAPDPMDRIWIYSPLLSSQPIGEKGHLWSIIVNSSDVETHRLRDLVRTPQGWFDHLILRPLDRRYARHLKAWTESAGQSSLGGFLGSHGLRMLRGGSPRQTGLPDHLLLKATNYRQLLGLDGLGFSSYPHDELRRHRLTGTYSRLFAGNILLIPRSMNEVLFLKEPVGFSSTFNAIYSVEPREEKHEETLLSAMAAYLKSDVAHYFYALIGKSWILDHARLEKYDLEAVPFPFKDQDNEAFETLLSGDQNKITALVTKRVGLDDSFAGAVKEYKDFRSGYEDSQLPASSLQSPADEEVDRYSAMLDKQLAQSFGSQSETFVQLEKNAGEGLFARLLVRVQRRGERAPGASDLSADILPGQFNPYSVISYHPHANIVVVIKPWTHVAWTIEQAFADAQNISAALLRSGAAA